ncbi:MAG: agmatinase [Candidatus Kapaibacterium sp.]
MKLLTEENNFLSIDEKYSNYQDSEILIISAPYEHTVSYGGGTAYGPEAILAASAYVEFYDDETDRELCFEKGIAAAEPIDFKGAHGPEALDLIAKEVKQGLNDGKFVVTLGGEHTISSAIMKAHHEKFPGMSVLQFDAHSDFRDTYEGSKYSHACVMARLAEFLDPSKITQIGIRAQCKEEAEFIRKNRVNTFYASAIRRGLHGDNWQKKAVEALSDDVYVTFDVDYFDPAIMPGTGTPEPDGFLYSETADVFREIKKQGKRLIGFDVVELAPVKGLNHPEMTTARLIYKILNICL